MVAIIGVLFLIHKQNYCRNRIVMFGLWKEFPSRIEQNDENEDHYQPFWSRVQTCLELVKKNNVLLSNVSMSSERITDILNHDLTCFDQVDFILREIVLGDPNDKPAKALLHSYSRTVRIGKEILSRLIIWLEHFFFKTNESFQSHFKGSVANSIKCRMCQSNIEHIKIKDTRTELMEDFKARKEFEEAIKERVEQLQDDQKEDINDHYSNTVGQLSTTIEKMEMQAIHYERMFQQKIEEAEEEEIKDETVTSLLSRFLQKIKQKMEKGKETKIAQLKRILVECDKKLKDEPVGKEVTKTVDIQETRKDCLKNFLLQEEISHQQQRREEIERQMKSMAVKVESVQKENIYLAEQLNQIKQLYQKLKYNSTAAQRSKSNSKTHSVLAREQGRERDSVVSMTGTLLDSNDLPEIVRLKQQRNRFSMMNLSKQSKKNINTSGFSSKFNDPGKQVEDSQLLVQEMTESEEIYSDEQQEIVTYKKAKRSQKRNSPAHHILTLQTATQCDIISSVVKDSQPQQVNQRASLLNSANRYAFSLKKGQKQTSEGITLPNFQSNLIKKNSQIKRTFRQKDSRQMTEYTPVRQKQQSKDSKLQFHTTTKEGQFYQQLLSKNKENHQFDREHDQETEEASKKRKRTIQVNQKFLGKSHLKKQRQLNKYAIEESIIQQPMIDSQTGTKEENGTYEIKHEGSSGSMWNKCKKNAKNKIFVAQDLQLFGGLSQSFIFQKNPKQTKEQLNTEQGTCLMQITRHLTNLKKFEINLYGNIVSFLVKPYTTIETNQICSNIASQAVSVSLQALLRLHGKTCPTNPCSHFKRLFRQMNLS